MYVINNREEYEEVIYSGDARHKLRIYFNNVELENADYYCEKLTIKSRILPNGEVRFSLDNFISKEAELILHDISEETIQDQIDISIGTLVGDTYEYVPIGIFNIQDKPTTDKNKITIQLRDNSVKFDFNYNAQPLMEETGKTTKLAIFNDICEKAGVETDVLEFSHCNDELSIFDNTITARTYISYLAEQSGAIPTITRDGILTFIYINNLQTIDIPLHIVEKYEAGDKYSIRKVEYEDAIRKFEKIDEENEGDYLFINSANPYISTQDQIEAIFEVVNGFEIDSMSTGKVRGNPLIDPWDLIRITDGDKILKTLATNTLTYNGVLIQTFDTKIGLEEKKQNVTVLGDAPKFNRVFTELDNLNGEVRIVTEQTQTIRTDLEQNYYEKTSVNQLIQNSATGITNTFSEAGGNNIFRNTGLWNEKTGYANSSNLFDEQFRQGAIDENPNYNSKRVYVKNSVKLTAGQTYTLSTNLDSSLFKYSLHITSVPVPTENSNKIDDSGWQTGTYTYTPTQDCYLNINLATLDGSSAISVSDISNYWFMLNTGSTALPYEPSRYQNQWYEYWIGNVKRNSNEEAANGNSLLLQNGIVYQEQEVPNGNYCISFQYNKTIGLSNVSVIINDIEYSFENFVDDLTYPGNDLYPGVDTYLKVVERASNEFIFPITVNSRHINVKFKCDTDNGCEIYDLMVNAGSVKLAYSQNQNEVHTTTVNIGEGITIEDTNKKTKLKADADGIRITDTSNNVITKFTDKGIETDYIEVRNEARIVGTLFKQVGNHTWINKI